MRAESHTFAATVCGLAWQADALRTATPVLAANGSAEHAVAAVLEHAMTSFRAAAAAVSLYDARCHRYRVIAVATADERPTAWLAPACDLPAGFPSTAPNAGDVLVLPDDDPEAPLARRLADAASTVAYVTLAYGSEVIGVLHVVRAAVLPFTPRERCAVHTIAESAVCALTAVRVL